jgi:hypothetical protein
MAEPIEDQAGAVAYTVGVIVARRPQNRQPPPWVADMIAAAYRGDEAGVRDAADHMSEPEQRTLHAALALLIKVLVTRRLQASSRRRVTSEVIRGDSC